MVNIYDSSLDPEEYARQQAEAARQRAEIDAEIAAMQQRAIQQALAEFDAVPSYVERFKDGRAVQED